MSYNVLEKFKSPFKTIIRRNILNNLLKDKNIVVMGVANQRSIAWGITKSLHKAGANLIFTNRQKRSYKKLTQLLEKHHIDAELIVTCDVSDEDRKSTRLNSSHVASSYAV